MILRRFLGTKLKQIINWKASRKNKRGNTLQRWLDQVMTDIVKVGINDWQRVTANRQE